MTELTGGLSEVDVSRFRDALRQVSTRPGKVERVLHAIVRLGLWVTAWRLTVRTHELRTRERDFGAGHVIAVAPHRAWVEPFLLLAAWPRDAARLVWLADGRTVTRSWWRRWLLPRVGIIPIVGRIGGPAAYAELAAEALATGVALVVFPEVGPPSAPDEARRISPGFAYLARRAGAPILPVVVGGSHRICRGSSFSLDFLASIDAGEADPNPFVSGSRRRAHDLADAYAGIVAEVLPLRTAQADAAAPRLQRWRWLATLFG